MGRNITNFVTLLSLVNSEEPSHRKAPEMVGLTQEQIITLHAGKIINHHSQEGIGQILEIRHSNHTLACVVDDDSKTCINAYRFDDTEEVSTPRLIKTCIRHN